MLIVLCGVSDHLGSKIIGSLIKKEAKAFLVKSSEMPSKIRTKLPVSTQKICIIEISTKLKILLSSLSINEHTKEINPFTTEFYSGFFDVMQESLIKPDPIVFVNIKPIKLTGLFKTLSKSQNASPIYSSFRSVFGCLVVTLFLPNVSTCHSSNELTRAIHVTPLLLSFPKCVLRTAAPTFSISILLDWLSYELPTLRSDKVLTSPQKDNLCYLFTKRSIDFVLALIGLVVMFVPMCIIGLLIKAEGGGPVIFAQKRLGQHENIFTCYKFRTMAVGTPQVGTHEVSETSISSLSSSLRRLKLDELPQLLNVLYGQMSLIGPRPCLPNQSELIRLRRAYGVFEVLPGISGLSQIFGVDMSNPEKLAAWDNYYLKLQCILLDVLLIFRTVFGLRHGDSRVVKSKKSKIDADIK